MEYSTIEFESPGFKDAYIKRLEASVKFWESIAYVMSFCFVAMVCFSVWGK